LEWLDCELSGGLAFESDFIFKYLREIHEYLQISLSYPFSPIRSSESMVKSDEKE